MTKLIGFTGKPGSKKHRALRLTQEYLATLGHTVSKYSISWGLNNEIRQLIPMLQSHQFQQIQEQWRLTTQQIQILKTLDCSNVGEEHPEWGFNRSNDHVRKIMSTFAVMRRERDESLYLRKMLAYVENENLDYALVADVRFPNEADAFLDNNGLLLHFDVDQTMLDLHHEEDQSMRKYDPQVVSQDPVETALDQYSRFTLRTDIYTYDVEALKDIFLNMENFNFEEII